MLRRCKVIYTALYRKYRPQNFAQVIGQETIVTALQNQVSTGRIGHAYLFTGTRGTGKTSCAKIFAKAVNCPNSTEGEPCGTCEVCTGIVNGSIFDVVEIDAASNNGVDDVRSLREETAYVPALCKYKVYIIDEVHMLSSSAFNALLKIMEEPPAHVVFILATTEIHKVPATVLSRCQRFDFHRIPTIQITKHLLQVADNEGISLNEDAAALIARLADGAARDALSLLDTCITTDSEKVTESTVRSVAGIAEKSYLFSLSSAINKQNMEEAFAQAELILSRSTEVKRLTEELIYHYRNVLLAGFAASNEDMIGTGAEYFEQYKQAAKEMSKDAVIYAIKTLGNALDKIGKGTDPRIELELALVALCAPQEGTVHINAPKAQAATKPEFTNQVQEPPKETEVKPEALLQKAPPQTMSIETPKMAKPKEQEGTEEEAELEEWVIIVEKMAQKDSLLYSNMLLTKAYLKGNRVLIDGSEMFMEYLRVNEHSKELIKDIIEEELGKRYAIGPYEKKQQDAPVIEETILGPRLTGIEKLEQIGVPIEYED